VSEIVTSGAIMFGIAFVFGVTLAFANRVLYVEEDPRIDAVENKLPGTNCGACGQPGCHAFAEVLVRGDALPGKCTVSSPDAKGDIATYLGVDVGFEETRVARLRCAGGRSSVRQIADYRGLTSCRAAVVINGGGRACPWGCLGFGDCERACGFDAIRMSDEGLPVVDVERCTACGDCVDVCPLDLFALAPVSARALVQCSSPLTGEVAHASCRVACDGCGRCALDAPEGAIEMAHGLPIIRDPDRATEGCTFRCPTGAIQWVEGNQFEPRGATHG
jgi:RnfABCDGE-type electron transport complex B subunit